MAILSLILFAASLGALLLPAGFHEAAGALLLVTLVLHNLSSKGFYRNLGCLTFTPERKKDAAVILLLGLFCALVYLSAAGLLLNYCAGIEFLPSFPWLTVHEVSAGCAALFLLLHMKKEWG